MLHHSINLYLLLSSATAFMISLDDPIVIVGEPFTVQWSRTEEEDLGIQAFILYLASHVHIASAKSAVPGGIVQTSYRTQGSVSNLRVPSFTESGFYTIEAYNASGTPVVDMELLYAVSIQVVQPSKNSELVSYNADHSAAGSITTLNIRYALRGRLAMQRIIRRDSSTNILSLPPRTVFSTSETTKTSDGRTSNIDIGYEFFLFDRSSSTSTSDKGLRGFLTSILGLPPTTTSSASEITQTSGEGQSPNSSFDVTSPTNGDTGAITRSLTSSPGSPLTTASGTPKMTQTSDGRTSDISIDSFSRSTSSSDGLFYSWLTSFPPGTTSSASETMQSSTSSAEYRRSSSKTILPGSVVGGVIFLSLVGISIYLVLKRRRRVSTIPSPLLADGTIVSFVSSLAGKSQHVLTKVQRGPALLSESMIDVDGSCVELEANAAERRAIDSGLRLKAENGDRQSGAGLGTLLPPEYSES